MRTCYSCKQQKPATEWYANQSACKACHRKNSDRRRKANPQKHRDYANEHAAHRRAQLIELKEGKPCADCGQVFHHVCMDWDHVRGEKLMNVSQMVNRAWDQVLAEIEKCELVCANCHRLRTWRRLQAAGVEVPPPAL